MPRPKRTRRSWPNSMVQFLSAAWRNLRRLAASSHFWPETVRATSPLRPFSPTAASCRAALDSEGNRDGHMGARDGDRHRVVIIGGGFGGLPAARLLGSKGKSCDVLLVDRRNHHLFQPLLYQVATGMLSPGEIAP